MPPLESSLLLIAISLCSLASQSAIGAVTTQTHRQDLRHLPSPLPGSRARGNPTIMKIELSPMKRSAGTDLLSNSTARSTQKKRFKTSGKVFESTSYQSIASSSSSSSSSNNNNGAAVESSNSSRARESWRDDNDLNNNSIQSDDNNNQAPPVWRRNIDSVNGTVDLSQYQRNDIDRLYGDALLVYFKNFNESLPARRELISINGTISSAPLGSRNRIPIYRSVPTSEPK